MIPEELIWEILIHLPTKSLMRFKCVSKLWYSIIHSRKFAIAHGGVGGGCFRGLLIRDIYFHPEFRNDPQLLFYLNINGGSKLMQHQLTIDGVEDHCKSTEVVKGLIGLYDDYLNNFTLCNIATHELLKLPRSPSLLEDGFCEFTNYLGFDVVEEVFKVLSVCCRLEEDEIIDRITHVFTLGVNNTDMSWRSIADPTPLDFYNKGVRHLYINGVLYWVHFEYRNSSTLTAFHVNSETFESIDISELMFQSRYPAFVENCGRPALMEISLPSEAVGMLDVSTINIDRRGGELESWTRKRLVLPTSFHRYMFPTRDMIFSNRESDSLPLHIYMYDHLKNEFDSIKVEEEYGCQRSEMYSQDSRLEFRRTRICYFEENLISLSSLMEDQIGNIFSVILEKYPNLVTSLSMYTESQRDRMYQGICLVDSEKAKELEDCWIELCMKGIDEFHRGKMELLATQSSLVVDAWKQKWQAELFSNIDV